MKNVKRILLVLLLVIIGVVAYNYSKLNIISGYAAKNMASNVFLAHRNPNEIATIDNNIPLIKLANAKIEGKYTASATVFGLMERKVVYRNGFGALLINDEYDEHLQIDAPRRSKTNAALVYPFGNAAQNDTVFENIDYEKLNVALKNAFGNADVQKTRTSLVIYKDQIIAEKYADGITKETPILGWSMTKSVLATLYGILECKGELSVNQSAPIAEWQKDERKNITIDHLLRMQSGLEWEEDYTKISDVTKMLFLDSDMSAAQRNKKAIAKPTEVWNYSSGTSNLLSGILKKYKKGRAYIDFPYKAFIDKIGMSSMILEADTNYNYVGSSYGWATTRDWGKFGLLYLHRGNWNGEQIFEPQWADYVAKPTAHSNGVYGAHFWLNAGGKFPDVPRDMYSANGYQGQYVFIIPSKDLVVVRTGLAENPVFDVNKFLSEIISAIN